MEFSPRRVAVEWFKPRAREFVTQGSLLVLNKTLTAMSHLLTGCGTVELSVKGMANEYLYWRYICEKKTPGRGGC